MYFHFVLVSTLRKNNKKKNQKKFLQFFLLWGKKINHIFGLLISLPGKAPVTFSLTNSCVAECKAACSSNFYPAASGTSPSWKHLVNCRFWFCFYFPRRKKNSQKSPYFHGKFELEGWRGSCNLTISKIYSFHLWPSWIQQAWYSISKIY